MNNIAELIRKRRSVRTYNGRELSQEHKENLISFMANIENPYNLPVDFKLMDAKEKGLTCPVVSGTDLYVGGKMKRTPFTEVAFGYSFEMLVLYAQSLGIGTVWLGGTMNRPAYEAAMELNSDEIMPCASALGYEAKKMSVRETMMRKAIKANDRLPFEELFFEGNFKTPLTEQKADILSFPLNMVRLAPSAVNKQPWRIVVTENAVHFYLKRSKGFSAGSSLDMQKIDMGIALCHFALAAKESGLNIAFSDNKPEITADSDTEYIASYLITD